MSEELKKLKAAWDSCESDIARACGEILTAATSEGNLAAWLHGAREDLLELVVAARANGVTGNDIQAFLGEAPVRKAWTEIEAQLKKMDDMAARMSAACDDLVPLRRKALQIADDAREEAASLKRKLTKSQTVPDLLALADEIDKQLADSKNKLKRSVDDLIDNPMPDKSKAAALARKQVDADIAASKNSAKAKAELQMRDSRIDPRHLVVVCTRMNERGKAAGALVVTAKAARDKPDAAALKDALAQLKELLQAAAKEYKVYADAYADAKDTRSASKDWADVVKRMTALKTSFEALKKIAAAAG